MADETPKDAVDAGRAPIGDNTATGVAARDRAGENPEEEHPDDREIPETTSSIKPDAIATEAHEPQGAQTEEAKFLVNGSLPHGMVASNSGFVPVSAVTTSQEEADAKLEEHADNLAKAFESTKAGRQKLTDSQIERMGGAELRAVAHDRGYEIRDTMGARGTRAEFKRLQKEDESLATDEK